MEVKLVKQYLKIMTEYAKHVFFPPSFHINFSVEYFLFLETLTSEKMKLSQVAR